MRRRRRPPTDASLVAVVELVAVLAADRSGGLWALLIAVGFVVAGGLWLLADRAARTAEQRGQDPHLDDDVR